MNFEVATLAGIREKIALILVLEKTHLKSHLDWKRLPRSWSLRLDQTPPCQLDQSTECHVQFFFDSVNILNFL